ncbi:MAG: Divalent metal cation transporter MntH [bacterium ADurb.Bin400]|nr:MAG: Divalent metal cation transporter MntH [bacterium ADurb.Bin400]
MDSDNKLLTLSEFRRELGIPLVLAKKLIVWGEVEAVRTVDGTIRVTEEELLEARDLLRHPWTKTKLYLRSLGPGLITGVSDDDPGGIGTYSSVGAAYGYALLWTAAWLLPMMLAVQEACARIGIVTNRGLAGVLQRHYKRRVVMGAVLLLIIANVVNIGADIGAMAAALGLITRVDFIAAVLFFALLMIGIEVLVPYRTYSKVLKWLTLSVLAYVVTGIMIKPDWSLIAEKALAPEVHFTKDYLFAMVAVFGTTITPYLFFWQTSEEVEEKRLEKDEGVRPLSMQNRIARMRTDVKTGMVLANLVFFFIVVTTAQVLHANGITTIESAEQAAEALRPLAGDRAFLLFALGIIGTGLLAVPILAGSGAYALSELMKWREGLGYSFSQAKGFYLIIVFSILVGVMINFIGINPITALYYSAYLNGIVALPLLAVIMVVGGDSKIMGQEVHPRWVKVFGWMAVVFMAIAVILTVIFSVS